MLTLERRGAAMYVKGYRYCVEFASDSTLKDPMFFKTSEQIGRFMRMFHPNEKNYRGYPIDKDGNEIKK